MLVLIRTGRQLGPFYPETCGLYYKSFMIIIYDHIDSGQYYKTMIMIVSCAPHLTLAYLVSSITIISDAPNCGITYDRQSDNRNSFIIQAKGANTIKAFIPISNGSNKR